MDLLRAWTFMGFAQKFSFLVVFAITALALVRAVQVAAWTARPVAGDAADRARTAGRWARATRGHARAALWFVAAAGAFGLASAYNYLGNSTSWQLNPPIVFYIIDDSVLVLDAAAVGLALCAAIFAIALGLDVTVSRLARPRPAQRDEAPARPRRRVIATAGRVTHRLLVILGLLAIAAALAEFRPNLEAGIAKHGERRMATDAFLALGLLWKRCAPIAAALGVLTWLATLAGNGATGQRARRRL
jgi:hypothetical protein